MQYSCNNDISNNNNNIWSVHTVVTETTTNTMFISWCQTTTCEITWLWGLPGNNNTWWQCHHMRCINNNMVTVSPHVLHQQQHGDGVTTRTLLSVFCQLWSSYFVHEKFYFVISWNCESLNARACTVLCKHNYIFICKVWIWNRKLFIPCGHSSQHLCGWQTAHLWGHWLTLL